MAEQRTLNAERADFEQEANAARFFPREIDFTRTKSPSGRDEYANSHLQSRWEGWQAACREPPALDAEGLPHVKTWQERIGAKPGAPDGVVRFAMLEEIADLRAQLARTSAPEGAPVAWAVTAPKGGIHKLSITRDSAERKAARWREEWPDNACQVRPLVFGDAAPASASAQPAEGDHHA